MLHPFGQLICYYPRFVHYRGVCPHKLKKNWRCFLESAPNRRNFASTKNKDSNCFIIDSFFYSYVLVFNG